MLLEAMRFITGILYGGVGLRFLIRSIRNAWGRGHRQQGEEAAPPAAAPPASRPTVGSRDTGSCDIRIRLVFGAAIVLAGVGFMPLPALEGGWASLLIFPLAFVFPIAVSQKAFRRQRP